MKRKAQITKCIRCNTRHIGYGLYFNLLPCNKCLDREEKTQRRLAWSVTIPVLLAFLLIGMQVYEYWGGIGESIYLIMLGVLFVHLSTNTFR